MECIWMSGSIDGGVLAITIAALSISGMSLYVSRVFLPRKMKKAYLKSITVLAAAVETKDSGTVGHAQRVADMTMAIARNLGITGKELERIEYAALLRDIGKANVPHAVLNKAGPLAEEEWVIVKSHAVLGADMVESVPFLADSAPYVRHHHEYWDGTGYPDGLKGEDIPLGSRILAATSDYDAMISERPYHAEPMTMRQAINEIRAGSGTRYDPVVVKIITDMLSNEINKAA
jgi:putative nucleotidyltransferase with HDIG domain